MVEGKPQVDVQKALQFRQQPYEVELTNNDAILYALGIGFQQDAMNANHYKFTYENADSFQAFPTNALTVCHRGPFADGEFEIEGIPAFNPMQLLHGEEQVTFNKPLVPGFRYVVQEKIADFQDKGKGALLIFDAEIKEKATNDLVATVRSSLFVRGLGGFGYKGTIKSSIPKLPKRAPDFVKEEVTQKNQAFLYRLCNDRNPLHVDPEMSAMGGFEVPILHGLCSYGFSSRVIQEKYCNNDPQGIGQINARFTSHVLPGETLVVNCWKEGNNVIFATTTKERGKVTVQGYVTLKPSAKL